VPDARIFQNDRLRKKLESLAHSDPDYWSFRGNAKRDHGHGLMQYPAMMVPQMVRALLREICETEPCIKGVGDPFVGSGTVLTESTLRGLDFVGRDINPLAILLCRVKAGPVFPEALIERSEELIARITEDRHRSIEANFRGIDKWFTRESQQFLSSIRRGIRRDGSLWARRFFWVALAETVRLCSNSRTSTFKLHIRSAGELNDRDDAKTIFAKVLKNNLARFASLGCALRQRGFLHRGHFSGKVHLQLGDARSPLHEGRDGTQETCDIIITSPPYGDNATTVPYGQYSYLPLQWIDLADIDISAQDDFLRTTHEIDRRSLGGSRRIESQTIDALRQRSQSLSKVLDQLASEPRDRTGRVTAFVRDLDGCIPHVLNMLRPDGVMVWVLGNRRVGGRSVPLDAILGDLLRGRGAKRITEVRRRIPSKRMAVRNSVAATMANEMIVVFRKGAVDGQIG
jgi:hypothetical protein